MRSQQYFLIILAILSASVIIYSFKQKQQHITLQNLLKKSYEKIIAQQYISEGFFMFKKIKGLFGSKINFNIMDKNNTWFFKEIREKFWLYDSNMFVTNFVLYTFIECHLANTFQLDETVFQKATDAYLQFRDQNHEMGVPIYSFWKQIQQNNTWTAFPKNAYDAISLYFKMPKFIHNIFIALFGEQFDPAFLAGDLEAFKIPADNDDSGLNMVLTTMISDISQKIPKINAKWNASNYNYRALYDKVKQYSYRPFDSLSQQRKSNSSDHIDSRTYYYLQGFLNKSYDDAKSQNITPSLILFSTWLTNEEEQIFGLYYQPGGLNNVDVTVNANALFGLMKLLQKLSLEDAEQLFDIELRQIVYNVTNLIQWTIESDIIKTRPDLALTYYPSVYDFYWFVARTVQFLDQNKENLKFQEQKYCLQTLQSLIKNQVTQQIISQAIIDNGLVYWEEFLGIYNKKDWHQDRFFSTAVALNALIDTWTIRKDQQTLIYSSDTPDNVKQYISKGIKFLKIAIENDNESTQNAFFSGSYKGYTTFQFFYPANLSKYLNGTKLDPQTASLDQFQANLLYGIEGYVNGSEYYHLVNDYKWFNYSTPQIFYTFNIPKLAFPFWSSEAITYSMTMLVISKAIQMNDQI